jgi:Mg2+ and Co2+ transporter CorA
LTYLLTHPLLKLWNLITREDTRSSIALTTSNLRVAQDAKSLTELALKVAQDAKNDSHAMKTIAFLTMVFLPGTFFAAFFTMPLFDEKWIEKRPLWLYWTLTLATTFVVLAVWAGVTLKKGWRRRGRKKSA